MPVCNTMIQILRCCSTKLLGVGSGIFAKFSNCWGAKYSLRRANTSCRRKLGIVYIILSWRQAKINGCFCQRRGESALMGLFSANLFGWVQKISNIVLPSFVRLRSKKVVISRIKQNLLPTTLFFPTCLMALFLATWPTLQYQNRFFNDKERLFRSLYVRCQTTSNSFKSRKLRIWRGLLRQGEWFCLAQIIGLQMRSVP